jgi:hypothetical protein
MHLDVPARLKRAILLLFLVGGVAFGAATAVRYGLIERDDLGPACEVVTPAWWCHLRMLVIRAFLDGVFGYASLAFALLASWRRRSWLAYAGVVVGTFGMVLYDFTWSGAGVVASALVVARLQGQWQQHRQAEQHAR